MRQKLVVRAVALALAFPAIAVAGPTSQHKPDTLLAIDANRASVIEGIVYTWGPAFEQAANGMSTDALRARLQKLRADQLLAASVAGSFAGIRDVLADAQPVSSKGGSAKALGDATNDVVYTPVTPCRLVETRNAFPAVYQDAGPFTAGEVRTYTIQSGNGQCVTQLPNGLHPGAVQLQVFGIPVNNVSGDIEVLPEGATFGNTATLVFPNNVIISSTSTTARVNPANDQISVQVRTGSAEVAIDIVGYFTPPDGGFVASVTAGTGITLTGTAADPIVSIADGFTGPTGPTGPTGATGATGAAGADGAPGAPGAQGAPGPTGSAGADGATGATGANGADGKSVLNGTGTPDNGVGSDGEFFIDTATSTIYGPKASGAWPVSGVSLVGAAGATGATGAAGATGATGPAGATGSAGAPGAPGAPGAAGPTGPTGATGSAGTAGATGATGATGGTSVPITLVSSNPSNSGCAPNTSPCFIPSASNYTLVCTAASGNPAIRVTLPAASSNSGKVYIVKRGTGVSGCTVGATSIDGSANVTAALDAPGGGILNTSAMTFQSDGSTWWIIGHTNN